VRIVLAPILQNTGHLATQQPYFFVQLTNVTRGNALVYSSYNFSNQAGVPWQTVTTPTTAYGYTDWQLFDIAPSIPAINLGDTIDLQILAAGCSLGGHFGELYVGFVGTTVPGISVSGTAMAQLNGCGSGGSNALLTYTLTYENGAPAQSCTTAADCTPAGEACVSGVCAETGVAINFTTPPNTTFFTAVPSSLAVCTLPNVGTTGTVTCTFADPMLPGASGNMAVTVIVPCGFVGPILSGNYEIHSNQETPLLGTPVFTQIGCTVDSDCLSGQWCDEAQNACTPKLANGQPIPNDPPHTSPTLNGTCTAAAATLVCTSGVCDSGNNECGYAIGHGPCSSGAPCQSGSCSVNGTCDPVGGCNVDADCATGSWCNETTHACSPKLPNGLPIPNDPPHTSPTLNGNCTAAAAALVCTSSICDPSNNECGYAIGGGPCISGTQCQSGACSINGTCDRAGGCNVDADCAPGTWCNETTHACSPTLPNGQPIPTDPAHTNPTLNATCTAAAGALVCASGVCDANDNECGSANGDGPCNSGNGGAVCRSGACSVNGTCEPAGGCEVNGDCVAPTPACDPGTHTCVAAPDAGSSDAGADAQGFVDAGGSDAGTDAQGFADAGSSDAGADAQGFADAATPDGGTGDASSTDASTPDGPNSDGSGTDASGADAALIDAAMADAQHGDSAPTEDGVAPNPDGSVAGHDAGTEAGPEGTSGSSSGCSCTVAHAEATPSLVGILVPIAVLASRRRRRGRATAAL
jgi:hypothetical protein